MSFFYNLLLYILLIPAGPLIGLMLLFSPKRRKTFLHRLGVSDFIPRKSPLADGPVWVHALSVGEVLSAVPLAEALGRRFGKNRVVFSASTQTGFQVAWQRLAGRVGGVFFFPFDLGFAVRRVVNAVSPGLVVIVESDVWPNFLARLDKLGIPALLVNARLSKRSFQGYRRIAFFAGRMFNRFDAVFVQSKADADRFEALGVFPEKIRTSGNVKFHMPGPAVTDAQQQALRKVLHIGADRRILVAGSTHRGEEGIVLETFVALRRKFPALMLILAPRDPERAEAVERLCNGHGLSSVYMSRVDLKSSVSLDVMIVDQIGALSRLYSLADIAFVGGSLAPLGGHNPLEPAAFSKPVLFGPDMSDFATIATALIESGGAVQVQDAESFQRIAESLLSDSAQARNMGERALSVFADNQGAVESIVAEIEKLISGRRRPE